MWYKTIIWTFLVFLMIVMGSCGSDEPEVPVQPARRTILVYMVATNSLGGNERDLQDLEEMDEAVSEGALDGCRLLVYRVSNNETPSLFEIKQDKHGSAVHEQMFTYSNEKGSSLTDERISQVVTDMKSIAPAQQYGLVLWSHGTGWARSIITKSTISPKDFGEDNGETMTITQLADALPTGIFEWIYADACYMGCVEVAFELRKQCHYFVGYPTEIPAKGMPYDKTLPLLCKPQAGLVEACQLTYDFYNALNDQNRTFTGVVVDCSHIDALAEICRQIQAEGNELESLSGLQYYNINSSRFFYDFLQYYQAISPDEMQNELLDAYNKVVIYKVATPTIFNRILIDPNHFSGLSTYIKGTSPGVNEQYYSNLAWASAIWP